MNLEEYIQRIKDQIDVVEYIGKHISLKKAGRNWVGLCPFHAEKTPSFSISREKGIFYCFGCHAGGDLLAFVQQYERLDFKETVDMLGEKAGLPPMSWSDRSVEKKEIKKEMQSVLHFFMTYCQQKYNENESAQKYMQKRGIQPDTARLFSLGYAPNEDKDLVDMLEQKGFDLKTCQHLGLIKKDSMGRWFPYFRNRILFPILDAREQVVGFGGRSFNQEALPKYLNSPEHSLFQKGKHLFGLSHAKNKILRDKCELIVVEGYMDAISLYQHGVEEVCASLGTAFTSEQARLASRYASKVLFCFDNDIAGVQATFRSVELMLSMQLACGVINIPPPFKDPDDFIRAKGIEAWKELSQKALDPWDFLWDTLWAQAKGKDPQWMEQTVMTLMKKVSKFPEDMLTESIIKRVALDTGLSIRILHDRLRRLKSGDATVRSPSAPAKKRTKGNIPSLDGERIILKSLIEKTDHAFHEMIFLKIEENDFADEKGQKLFSFLKKEYEKNGYLLSKEWMMHLPDDEMKRWVSELFFIEEGFYNDTAVLECILKTEENKVKKYKVLQLKDHIIQAEKEGNISLSKQLREELKRIV